MPRILLLSAVLLLPACGAPSATLEQPTLTDPAAPPEPSATPLATAGDDIADFRDSLNSKLDVLEGRLAIFCFGATEMGSMPSTADILAAVENAEDLLRHADDLQELEPPQGALAVGNDASDVGVAIAETVFSAGLIGADLDAGTIEPLVAETLYLDRVIIPCDILFDHIEELREAADVLE